MFQKITITLLGIFFYAFAKSQTIVEADLPNPGDIIVEYQDTTNLSVYNIGPSGSGQSWNFSQFSIDDTTGINCLTPSSIPWNAASYFLGAEFGNYDVHDTTAGFYVTNSTGMYTLGYYKGGADTIIYHAVNGRLNMPVPFSSSTVRNHASYIEIFGTYITPNFQDTFDVKVRSYLLQHFTCDGGGSLATPAGNYPSTLRMKELSFTIDSIYADTIGNGSFFLSSVSGPKDTVLYYRWVANNLPCYRFQIQLNPINNQVIGASMYDNDFVLTHIKSQSSNAAVQLFPNPVNGNEMCFTFMKDEFTSITIFDAQGLAVLSENVSGKSKWNIPTGQFENGIYFYRTNDGSETSTGKFIIQR